jgi:hypothetical protein
MKKAILTIEHVNVHGEKMTLVLDKDNSLWFKHDDCNTKFESFNKLQVKGNFKYVLSKEEQIVFKGFVDMATNFLAYKLK